MDENSAESSKWSLGMDGVKVDLKRAIVGGSISFVVIMLGSFLLGHLSGSEAFQLFKTTLPSTLAFCGTISLALGNILALMLTLLSLSASMDFEIKWEHYQRVKQIAWVTTVTLLVTILFYLLMNIPVVESEKAPSWWFTYIYYGTLGFSSLLGGAFITIILLLYNTIRDMISILNPNKSSSLRHTEEDE